MQSTHALYQPHSEGPTCSQCHLKGGHCPSGPFWVVHTSGIRLSSSDEPLGSRGSVTPRSLLDILNSPMPSEIGHYTHTAASSINTQPINNMIITVITAELPLLFQVGGGSVENLENSSTLCGKM